MNTGAIAARYAKALLKLVDETGRGEQVCAQVRRMLEDPNQIPKELEPDLCRFVSLVKEKGRESYLRLILHSFVSMYDREHGIKVAHLTTAVPDPDLEEQLRGVLTGCRLVFKTKVDPSIVGGFVLVVDDLMMDASVKRQLDLIRRQFIERNRRIV